jgi:hypothetical protein
MAIEYRAQQAYLQRSNGHKLMRKPLCVFERSCLPVGIQYIIPSIRIGVRALVEINCNRFNRVDIAAGDRCLKSLPGVKTPALRRTLCLSWMHL